MPGRLTVFGCLSLPVAADDLAIPAMVGVIFRSLAAIVAAVLLAIGQTAQICTPQVADTVFLSLCFVIAFITAISYIRLYKVVSEGDIIHYRERTKKTIPLYHFLAVIYIIEVGVGVLGLILISTDGCATTSELFIVELIAVVAIFVDFIILGSMLSILLYLSKGKKPKKLYENSYEKTIDRLLTLLSYLCCGFFGNLNSPGGFQELAWSEISRTVHTFLKDTLTEFTVTDLFTAFILIRAEQRANEAKRVESVLSTSPLVVSSSNAISSPSKKIRFKSQSFTASSPITGADVKAIDAMKEFDEFSPYMIGIYGWKLQLYINPLSFFSRFPTALFRRVVSGNEVEYHIFKSTVGSFSKKKRQIVYSSFTSYLGEAIPYTITVDHEKKAVVITLRGTLSVSDIALDLLCVPENLGVAATQWGVKNGEKRQVHGGMLRVANRIRLDIEKQQILHRLMRVPTETEEQAKSRESHHSDKLTEEDRESFLRAMGKGKNEQVPDNLMYGAEVFVNDRELSGLDCSNYRLVCLGHSLGSCMASILTVLLRPRFPQIHCLAYSCVSGIFCRELAEEASEYITSCTLGKDIFGRLSWHSAKELREKLLDALRRSKANKATILMSIFRKNISVDELIYPPDNVPNDLERREIQARIERFRLEEDTHLDKYRMFMPGNIMYLEKTHTEVAQRCCLNKTKSVYTPVWILDRSEIQDIQISSRLILDHMPDYLQSMMRAALEREITAHLNGAKRILSGSTLPLNLEV